MTNEKFYNSELKERYLNSIENLKSRQVASLPLLKAKSTEEIKNKDLYEMNREEIGGIISDLSPSSELSATNSLLRIEDYLKWTVSEGYRKSNILPFEGINKGEWSKQFVSEYRRFAFTREQIEEMIERLENYIDRAILLSMFEGIGGTGNIEILNLRIEDLSEDDGQHYVTLFNDKDRSIKNSRTIPISDLLAKTLEIANREDVYISKNGVDLANKMPHTPYEKALTVIKKMRRGQQGGELDTFFISRKLSRFKGYLDIKYLVRRHIIDSGMMHMANELYLRDGEFKREHFQIIGEQFNVATTDEKGTRRTTRIRRALEVKEFEELYGYRLYE